MYLATMTAAHVLGVAGMAGIWLVPSRLWQMLSTLRRGLRGDLDGWQWVCTLIVLASLGFSVFVGLSALPRVFRCLWEGWCTATRSGALLQLALFGATVIMVEVVHLCCRLLARLPLLKRASKGARRAASPFLSSSAGSAATYDDMRFEQQVPLMPAHEKINYVEFPSQDLPASKRFFGDAFGWTFEDYGPDYSAFAGEGLDGGFFRSKLAGRTENGGALLVFYSADLEDTLAKVIAAGAAILKPVFSFSGGRRFHFIEPGGNEFAVWSDPA